MIEPIRQRIARETRAMFAEPGAAPGARSASVPVTGAAMFPADAVCRRVHGDVGSMMVGGIAALLLQMLEPRTLGGVWDHSNFREDIAGRFRRTARFIAVTTYGTAVDAEAMVARIRAIHDRVEGHLPDGTRYAANDPALLNWVHIAGSVCFLAAYRRYVDPRMRRAEQDRYYAEYAEIAWMLGAADVPVSVAEVDRALGQFRPLLRADARTREITRIITRHRPDRAGLRPLQRLTSDAAVDVLPGWAKALHGFPAFAPHRSLTRLGTWGVAGTLRWALAG